VRLHRAMSERVMQSGSESNGQKVSRGSLLVIFLTVAIDLLGFGIVLPMLPIYARQFTVDESGWQLGLLMASYSAMQFLFAPFGLGTVWQSLAWLFVSRIGAGIAGATIPTAQAYIADTTTLETRAKGMALIGMAFGIGLTFGPLLGFLTVGSSADDPGPWPGFAAAGLSAIALLMAIFWLPESRRPGTAEPGAHMHRWVNLA